MLTPRDYADGRSMTSDPPTSDTMRIVYTLLAFASIIGLGQLLEFWARSLARPYMGKQISCPACNTINTVGALRCENCNQKKRRVHDEGERPQASRDLFDRLSARHAQKGNRRRPLHEVRVSSRLGSRRSLWTRSAAASEGAGQCVTKVMHARLVRLCLSFRSGGV